METHTGKLIRISLNDIDYKENTEYFVEISATTKADWGLLPKGFEVAHEQIPLSQKYKNEITAIGNTGTLEVKDSKDKIEIYNKDLNLVFDKKRGQIISYVFEGNELLKDGNGPRPNFWRAPTDNDFGNKMQVRNIEWKKASLFMKVAKLTSQSNPDGRVSVMLI